MVAASLGHGLGVVKTPAGSTMLYDAGRLGAGEAIGRPMALRQASAEWGGS